MANWIDTTFYVFDKAILNFYHNLAVSCGGFLTPVMRFISLLGTHGIFMIVLGVILWFFSKTRKIATSALISMLIGFLITNLILKNAVARLRPYTHVEFAQWWQLVGAPVEKDLSFPSGHVTVVASFITGAFAVSKNKKYTFLLFLCVIVMGVSRNYLMVHYPSDVLGGVLSGVVSGIIGGLITKLIYNKFINEKQTKFANFYKSFSLIKKKQK